MALSFEGSLNRLKDIVEKMENENTDLEESLKLYSEGIKLYQQCTKILEKTERKVEILKNGKQLAEEKEASPQVSLFQDVEE
jgi:exodeoxyribonuclease VII small subunit